MPFLQTRFDESRPQISPDGKWIAYQSNESGRYEIYVQPFPAGPGTWQISTDGGELPRWRGDGQESSRVLFNAGRVQAGGSDRYDVSPDGQRFLVNRSQQDSSELATLPITVVLNWPALMGK